MGRNKVKICCNPYKKSIEYYEWDEESKQYFELDERSDLSSPEYTENVTIQNTLQDIFKTLQKEYNLGNTGLDIEFEGTEDDYRDITDALKVFCSDYNITIYLGAKKLTGASAMMDRINREYVKLEKYFDDNGGNQETKEIISKYKSAVKPNIPICVMGLYSAGKSAFINSLIGQEILPSASEPTTARTYKITDGNKAEICFTYKNEKIVLSFNGSEYKPNKTGSLKILNDLQQRIVNNEEIEHTQEIHMYLALEAINDKEYNEDISASDIVEITVPFKKSTLPTSEYVFEIYDTPGSDSGSNSEHLDVLEKAIGSQTNGLPVLVTTPDDMDRDGNEDLLGVIKKMGNALDKTNTIIIVNKSDEKPIDTLKVKKNGTDIISKWQSNRMFFVSSVLGLGSKKEEPHKNKSWRNKEYCEVYKKNYKSFTDPEKLRNDPDYDPDDDYKQLYKYNILSEDKKLEYERLVEGDNSIFVNSGIHCIEYEISQFARKYALYNKCTKAIEYLDEAVKKTQEGMETVQKNLEEEARNIQNNINDKQRRLINNIESIKKEIIASSNDEYREKLEKKLDSVKRATEARIVPEIKQICKDMKKEKRNTRIYKAENAIKCRFKNDFKNKKKKTIDESKKYWEEAQNLYKERCMKAVSESNAFTAEQEEFLKEYIMSTPTVSFEFEPLTSYDKLLKGIIFKKIDEEKWGEHYVNSLKDNLGTLHTQLARDNCYQFTVWAGNLKTALTAKLSEFNPDLKKMTDSFRQLEKKKNKLDDDQNEIKKSKGTITSLTEFEGGN